MNTLTDRHNTRMAQTTKKRGAVSQ